MPGKRPLSPEAVKNDWPCAANCWKICCVVTSISKPQEQLICLARLSVAMRFKMLSIVAVVPAGDPS